MGVISPPVGVNAYVVSGIERDIPLQTVFKGAIAFSGRFGSFGHSADGLSQPLAFSAEFSTLIDRIS